ncbi:hypothetical protein EDD19_1051, partial [Dietzia cinnamea]
KRHIAREIYHALINDLQARDPATKAPTTADLDKAA